jgi:hypothetical protein
MTVADLHSVQLHGECVCAGEVGWSVCVTSWGSGVAAAVIGADRLRVVLAEPATRCRPTNLTPCIRLAAGRLLATEMSVGDSLDALCLLASRQLGSRSPGPSITLVDLYSSGRVDIASRIAPAVLHVPMQEVARSHTADDPKVCGFTARRSDRLAAYLPSFVELIPTMVLASLPTYLRQRLEPCQIRSMAAAAATAATGIRPAAIPPLMFAQRL